MPFVPGTGSFFGSTNEFAATPPAVCSPCAR
jgi:hypothetical protein